jgi:Cu2+-exporting ATPase
MALDIERASHAGPSAEELALASHPLGDGLKQTDLSVPAIHCGACIQSIESALGKLAGVEYVRVNLSTKRVSVRWREDRVPPLVVTLSGLGYASHLFADAGGDRDETLAELIRAVAIAGFAASNIMLLSVSVWSGAEGATRDLFHWVSALIAIPALVFAGRIFFRSAWGALSHGRMNMDVPIALGVSLAYAMSLYETFNHGDHAYFDAAVSLLFFLLIGRTLDHVMRDRARTAVRSLASLAPRGALLLRTDGTREYRPVGEIEPGMQLLIAAGDRIPVDARVIGGVSDLDCSLVTGESEPQPAAPGIVLRAGTMNLTGAMTIEATAAAKDSFLTEMLRLMEVAEGGRTRYRRIADRASALYSPVVHLTALLTFFGWMAVCGDWHHAITIAIAVLIITCPCALGLAVPIVQVVAARRLFENGIMVKDGSAMERLAEIDTVVFDKTGTLTMGRPRLMNADAIGRDTLALAAAIASHSRHPLSRAIFEAGPRNAGPIGRFERVTEFPGLGVEAWDGTDLYRLGRAEWALDAAIAGGPADTTLARNGRAIAAFVFEDIVRDDASEALSELRLAGLQVEMLSGDRLANAQAMAGALSIDAFAGEMLPGAKAAHLSALTAGGAKVLMVGDGLNDAPALSAAHVSMAPATAADVGRNAADFVFLRDSLKAVPLAFDVSRNADRLIRQNFALAVGYNAIAVPIAILGYVTPLIAAIAMSMSSLLVIGNALRLRTSRPSRRVASVARRGSTGYVAANHPVAAR